MISKNPIKGQFDIILITAEYYDDHPLSPAGMIARVLDAKDYSVGIIEKPKTRDDFTRMGVPKLCFCITSGSIDSMLNNYTPLKKKRNEDVHDKEHVTDMPDRAVISYCNRIREYFKGNDRDPAHNVKIVIGGIEASLRRFTHYDYWDNGIRRGILFDSRADILVYGNGEKQVLEIAGRLRKKQDMKGIEGTCVISKDLPKNFMMLPSFTNVKEDKRRFCDMQRKFSNWENLAQEYDNNYLLQYRYPEYTTKDLDWIYSLDFSRKLHPFSLLKMARFSVITHRGCIGKCNFCSIALHQGDKIISRSEENILNEIRRLTRHPDFKGYIDDLGGPSANMYGMDCRTLCRNDCIYCMNLDKSHRRLISLLRKARQIKGVRKIFIRSGIRYDLALNSREYIKEISNYHISGCLKIAPEHFSEKVLKLMNKNVRGFDEFKSLFESINAPKGQELKYYLMIGHPGDDLSEILILREKIGKLKNVEQFQFFTPTPMTVSSCMYWTGMNPYTMERVKIIYDYNTKKKLKRALLGHIEKKIGKGMDNKPIEGKNSEKRRDLWKDSQKKSGKRR
ncbi:YgiQ family radical SAM protein [Candidatus Woesearchaeota archaeon CG10_big_fil_rev_8_21_14_0_10_44_13]|nr:MAG: YgiQ family radical SAM protein [Candidatus Woesearchaeota archaeon CG10_big_fil_rev_8_21_14_0_10_44_13]